MQEIKLCPKCNKDFIVEWTTYHSNVDDKRESYISCPYCNAEVEKIKLHGNEDIKEIKIDL